MKRCKIHWLPLALLISTLPSIPFAEEAAHDHDHDHPTATPVPLPPWMAEAAPHDEHEHEDAHDHGGEEDHQADTEEHDDHDHPAEAAVPVADHDDHEVHDHTAEPTLSAADHDDHDDHRDHGHGDSPLAEADDHDAHTAGEFHLTPAQREALAIKAARLTPRRLGEALSAPGEIRLNAYATAQVTPRIAAQVVKRHVRMGDQVVEGAPLVTLSSIEMAQAQGELVVAEREWRRVKRLGRKAVSERRYLEARVARQQAAAKVIAFGLREKQVASLLGEDADHADGTFQLLAPRDGTVIRDDFLLGERVEPGRVLFEITDEHLRWAELRMTPSQAARVTVGDPARLRAGEHWFDGRVIQVHHQLDEVTRTQGVRIEVPDPEHRLHPGVFVDAAILPAHEAEEPKVLALPEAAVVRSPDGHWQVFVAAEEPDAFIPQEVELVRVTAGLAVIRGPAAGTEVVTHGSFFLQSELAKGGFDPHNH